MIGVDRLDWDGRETGALAARLRSLPPSPQAVPRDVAEILERVESGGDAALRELAERFGESPPGEVRVDPDTIKEAADLIDRDLREAVEEAAGNIEAICAAEADPLRRPATTALPQGQLIEVRRDPVSAAGIYAPGGRAVYPSTVLMCAIPARAAGVRRIAVASPPSADGKPSAPVLAACALTGVDEVYAVGGAQAIGALAFGTESIKPVDVIVGPGNPYVTEAKRQVAGRVGIDGVAGPSELMVVADGGTDPRWTALDLCAQAEHGEDSPLIVASTSEAFLDRVAEVVPELAAERPSVAAARIALVRAPGVASALELADAVAPEHLHLVFDGADAETARSRIAGCVFVGAHSGAAFGDYVAGSNHVLPTGGAARFGGPLGPEAFMRRTSVVCVSGSAAEALAPQVAVLARAEGFPVHAESAQVRAARR